MAMEAAPREAHLRRRGLVSPLAHSPSANEDIPSSFDYELQPPIEVRQGCMFIPIFIAVWWFWTRRAARRAMRLIISGDSCLGEEDLASEQSEMGGVEHFENHVSGETHRDQYLSWDDVVAQQSQSNHLVKWFTSNKRREAKRRMRAVTKSVMNRSSKKIGSSTHNDYENMDNLPDCDADDILSSSGCSGWECIDDDNAALDAPALQCLADEAPQHSEAFASSYGMVQRDSTYESIEK